METLTVSQTSVEVQTPEQEELMFLYQIKKELSLETAHDAIRLVASVLQALRQTLALNDATTFLNQLPDFLQLAFAANWELDEKRIPIQHLDELVSLVMERDQKNHKNLFKDEVQTLSIILLTLKGLYKFIDIENFEGISNNMRMQLSEVSVEAAA